MSLRTLPVGHVQGSSEVRAKLHNWCVPARTAAVAGRWFSSELGFTLHPLPWLTRVMQGSFLHCDLEEENRSKFVFLFEMSFISASAWDRVGALSQQHAPGSVYLLCGAVFLAEAAAPMRGQRQGAAPGLTVGAAWPQP